MKRLNRRNRNKAIVTYVEATWENNISFMQLLREKGAPEEFIEIFAKELYKSMIDGKDFEFTTDQEWKILDFESERLVA